MNGRFRVETIEGGLRFVASDGWVDIQLHGDGRGSLWTGTYNGTVAEVFGKRLFDLLRQIMPEAGIQVLSVELSPPDPYVEAILLGAGFQKDGTRRKWGENLEDVSCYSVLDSEVKYVVADPPMETPNESVPTG